MDRPPANHETSVSEAPKAPHSVTVRASAVEASPSAPSSATAPTVPEKGSYQSFLDRLRQPAADNALVVNELRDFVSDFPPDLTRLQAAQRVHDFLSAVTPKLVASAAFTEERSSEEARRGLEDNFERFVMNKLHKVVFRNLPADVRQDELVAKRLKEKLDASAGLVSLGVDLSDESQEKFAKAAEQLNRINQYTNPGSKVVCMLNAYHIVEDVVQELQWRGEASGSSATDGGDEAEDSNDEGAILRRVLQALVIEASPQNFFTNVEFAAAFRYPLRTTEEERSCLRHFSTALGGATGLTPKVPRLAIGAGGSWTWGGFEDLPPWLEGTGVSFRFEAAEAGNLLIGEVDELLSSYHRMASVLHSLAKSPPGAK